MGIDQSVEIVRIEQDPTTDPNTGNSTLRSQPSDIPLT
jgi:hypothetical protein